MTQFKDVADYIKTHDAIHDVDIEETVFLALKIADYLKNGEVSEGMLRAVYGEPDYPAAMYDREELTKDFRKMITKMFQEIEGENRD